MSESGFRCPDCGHHFHVQGRHLQGVTRTQAKVLDAVMKRLVAGEPSPTLKEIAAALMRSSSCSAQAHVKALERRGYLARQPGCARSIHLTEAGLLLFAPKENTHAA